MFVTTPHKIYSTAEWKCHIYSEWMMSDDASNMQLMLPNGATLLGTILSSDKTNISTLTSDRVPHPLLISLANISMKTCAKMSSDSFLLTVLLLVPKFIHTKKCTNWHCYTGLLEVVHSWADPLDLEAFFCEAQKFQLNGVVKPFWSDWILAEPSHFFTPEMLHHFHQEFYDHDAKWLINAVGEPEIDFCFSVLPHVTGFRHFHQGILKLKQVTGWCHHDIQCSIIAVSADAAPQTILTAIRALMDFWYLIQASHIDNNDLKRISSVLAEFHANKDAIITASFHCREGKKIITN
ncbi:hypothetical protein BDR07DRAFT_1386587 [Suillus spraguei]|nr:hypothetical protein BDR07DRAFT_1386587 [Suillus spraguei]